MVVLAFSRICEPSRKSKFALPRGPVRTTSPLFSGVRPFSDMNDDKLLRLIEVSLALCTVAMGEAHATTEQRTKENRRKAKVARGFMMNHQNKVVLHTRSDSNTLR